jgi:hypothetical protein
MSDESNIMNHRICEEEEGVESVSPILVIIFKLKLPLHVRTTTRTVLSTKIISIRSNPIFKFISPSFLSPFSSKHDDSFQYFILVMFVHTEVACEHARMYAHAKEENTTRTMYQTRRRS